MNKIHSCTQVKLAASCSFLPLPCASWFLGWSWEGVAWPQWGLTPEPFAGFWCRGSCCLTHLHLLPEIAAQQLAPVSCHRCPTQEGSPLPTPGGVGAQRASGDTASGTHAPATPAHTCSQSHQHMVAHLSPILAHKSPCCWPQAQGDTGRACAAHQDCHHRQEWGWMGTEADVLPFLPCGTPSSMLAHSSLDPPLLGGGVTRTRCPCTPPWPGRLGQGSQYRMGGEWSSGYSQSCPPTPSASIPILPSARLPVPRGRAGGQGATPQKMDG